MEIPKMPTAEQKEINKERAGDVEHMVNDGAEVVINDNGNIEIIATESQKADAQDEMEKALFEKAFFE